MVLINSNNYVFAMQYVKSRCSLTPLMPNTKDGFKLSWSSKKAKPEDIKDTPEKVESWWHENPYDNIAIVTGKRSNGLFVIDIDRKNGKNGTIPFIEWQSKHGKFPDTLVVSTPNHGMHYYYRLPEGMDSIKTIADIYDGVDVRGEGGVIVAPPSTTKDGKYQFINKNQVAVANQNVIDFIVKSDGYNKAKKQDRKAMRSDSVESETPFDENARVYEGERNQAMIRYVGILQAKGLSDEAISDKATTYNGTQFFDRNNQHYPLDKEEFKRTLESGLSYSKGGITLNNEENLILDRLFGLAVPPEKSTRDDTGSALLFAQVLKDKFCFVDESKKWYFFNGRYWQPDMNGKACLRYATYFYHALRSYACYLSEGEYKDNYRKFVDKLGQVSTSKHMIEKASAHLVVSVDDLDKNEDLLNLQNGTFNLKTQELQNHNSSDLITKIANVNYDAEASSKEFESYIMDIFEGDKAKIGFYQKMFGICLTTITSEEFALICYGKTRCGKSTGLEVLAHMLNTSDNGYACSVSPDSIAYKNSADGSKPTPDIARLRNVRYVMMSEPKKGMLLDSALLKQMVSGVELTGRKLNENTTSFLPKFTLIIDTNHLLDVNDPTIFTGEKLFVLKFDKAMERDRRDKTLKARLKNPDNLSGLLNWCLEGLAMYRQDASKNGLVIPDCVLEETKAYGFNSDKVGLYIDECLRYQEGVNIDGNDVFNSYSQWAKSNGYTSGSRNTFYSDLRQREGITMDTGKVYGRVCRNRIRNMYFTETGEFFNGSL